MKATTTRIASAIIDLAGEIGTQAEFLPGDAGIFGAETIMHLVEAERILNRARDTLRLAIESGEPAAGDLFTLSPTER